MDHAMLSSSSAALFGKEKPDDAAGAPHAEKKLSLVSAPRLPRNGCARRRKLSVSNSSSSSSSSSSRSSSKQMQPVKEVERREEELGSRWSMEEEVLDELMALSKRVATDKPQEGLGIVECLKHKNILITGATGFLGKVLVEKILRTQPEVGKLFLLVNADSAENAEQRLEKDVKGSPLFKDLKQSYGPEFFQRKLVAVHGKINLPDLGMDEETRRHLTSNVDVIINAAATTNFTERYDIALDINTKGPFHLLKLAKECPHLQLFLHVSTAFVNGFRKGKVRETPFAYGDSIRQQMYGDDAAPYLDVWKEIESVKAYKAKDIKDLGMQRANLHGWQDTYVFTKAMGEMLVNQARGDIPVVILRPSVVEATMAQPFPGWIQGIRMMDPILLAYGRGHIEGFYADPKGVLDVIPADMVVNSLLAALCCHAGQAASLNVYQIGSSSTNPLTFERLLDFTKQHFTSAPFLDENGVKIQPRHGSLHTSKLSFQLYSFLNYKLPAKLAELSGSPKLRKLVKINTMLGDRVNKLVDTYGPYTFYEGRFDITNTARLYNLMSPAEKAEFRFDMWSINWEDYVVNIHLPGLRRYNVRDGNSNLRPMNVMSITNTSSNTQ